MNVVLHGAGFENKGAEAMLRTVQFEWSQRCPDTTFFLAARPPDVHQALLHGIFPFIPPSPAPVQGCPLRHRLVMAIRNCLQSRRPLREVRLKLIRASLKANSLERFDAFVDISGYQYGDAWGDRGFNSVIPWVRYCRETKIPMIFLPQSWGPFTRDDGAQDIRQIMSATSLVMSRDSQSTRHLKTIDPTNQPKEFPDIAWLFERTHNSPAPSLPGERRHNSPDALVAIVPNMRVYEKTGRKGASNPYIKALADVARHAIRSCNATILLIPNEIRIASSQHPDDRYLCGILETMIGDRIRCIAFRKPASAEELKSILTRCDALIASRFHSLIFASSSGVPSLAIGWSHKYDELMDDLGMSEYSLPCSPDKVPDLIGAFDTLWAGKADIQKHLLAKSTILKGQAARAFDVAVDFVLKHPSP